MITANRQDASLRCSAMWHPWRALSGMPGVRVHWRGDLPVGLRAATDGNNIVMSSRLLQRERRAALAHELEHIRHGRLDNCSARDEAFIAQAAARRLITLDQLVSALRWTRDLHELAEELWVDVDTVRVRLEHLHPSEQHYVRQQLSDGSE